MVYDDEIKARLDIIKVLEEPNFRLATQTKDETYEPIGFKLIIDYTSLVMLKGIVQIYHDRSYTSKKEFSGQIPDAIERINAYIKEQFKPIIDEQKEKIKKLL